VCWVYYYCVQKWRTAGSLWPTTDDTSPWRFGSKTAKRTTKRCVRLRVDSSFLRVWRSTFIKSCTVRTYCFEGRQPRRVRQKSRCLRNVNDFSKLQIDITYFFPRDSMHSAAYDVKRCLFVRQSRSCIVSIRVYSRTFHHLVDPLKFFRTKRYGNILTGTALTGASNAGQVW